MCNESQRSQQLFCHISQIQICNTTGDKAGDMPLMVTAIIAAGRNRTIDYNAGQACDVVIKVFMCIRTACNRVRNMFATVLATITTIWRPGLSSSSFNSEQTEGSGTDVNFIIVLIAVQLNLRAVNTINWNRNYLQCSQYNV